LTARTRGGWSDDFDWRLVAHLKAATTSASNFSIKATQRAGSVSAKSTAI
jgi:hypothetical protein